MFDQTSPFFQRSKRIAEEFLQTTVIVDDQAYFEEKIPVQEISTPSTPVNLEEPGRRSGVSRGKAILEEPSKEPPQETGSHCLNAQKVINSFAQKRIVCSVIKPTDGDNSWITSVENLASSADILIIDWEVHGDDGENALNILERMIESATKVPSQLRLFAIYTGDNGIAGIMKEIKVELEKRLKITIEEQDNGFSLMFASTRIVIFAKPNTSNLPVEYEHRKVPFENLADRVTSEFAVMTAGLVSNVAIKSLTLVRKNTRKILNKFSVHLDAPYLTHRALQINTEDAEEFLTALVAEELLAILEEGNVAEEANLDSITEWLSSGSDTEFTLPLDPPKTFSPDQVVNLLKYGVDAWGEVSNRQKNNPHRLPLTQMFRPRTLDSQYLDERFGLVTTVRSSYEKKKPKLTFGTIVQNAKDFSYWVCLQPRCDCVRVESARVFPFLPLAVSNENNRFNLVLEEGTKKYIRLALKDKPYDLNLITFVPQPDDNQMIIAIHENSAYYFTDTKDAKYKWIGELRPEHAQRIANNFATNLSRVGLDESEWLRLWATKG